MEKIKPSCKECFFKGDELGGFIGCAFFSTIGDIFPFWAKGKMGNMNFNVHNGHEIKDCNAFCASAEALKKQKQILKDQFAV